MNLSVLYRGPLSSCNYACGYCPFSKRKETRAQLERDELSLERFAEWLACQTHHRWRVLFTPWGEALVRSWYRDAVTKLSHWSHVESVAVQTNLSCGIEWMSACRVDRLSLWATYHPTESSLDAFLRKVNRIHTLGIRICVGAVGVPEFLDRFIQLHQRLPRDVYFWINAQQPRRRPYTPNEIDCFHSLDPQFLLTLKRQRSFGQSCRTGQLSFTVNGAGDMRRCHFVDEIIGNCYEPLWEQSLLPRVCPNQFCDCYLGKAQLLSDSLEPFFGSTWLERLPNPPVPSSVLPDGGV